jgi:hypothetical protein
MRRTGKTARIVDDSIQTLFKEGEVVVEDHIPGHSNADRVCEIIMRRLSVEHHSTRVRKDEGSNKIILMRA